MRVLTFTSLFPSRVKPLHGLFIYQRMSHFARRQGNTVVAIAPVPYFPSWLRWSARQALSIIPGREQIGDIATYHPRYPLIPKISMPLHGWLMFLGSVRLARRLHHRYNFDFIDSHYVYPDGFAALLIGSILRLPVMVSARGTDINLFPSFRLIRPLIRSTLRRAAGAVAVSDSLRDAMVRLGMAADAVQVIGNGVDPERFFPEPRSVARQRLGLPQDAHIVVSVGGLVEAKGHHHLISAVSSLASRCPDLKTYLIGEGPSRARLQAMIRSLGAQDRVTLVGSCTNQELRFWYSAADLSVLTSSREGWPNVILESMACGTPVLATAVGAVSEIIASSDLGVIVDQQMESIAGGLLTAFERSWDRDLIAGYARRRTWDQVAAELEQWFSTRLALPSHSEQPPKAAQTSS